MILQRPEKAWAMFVIAPGAGGGIEKGFMPQIADALAEQGVATLRHELRPMEARQETYGRVREAVEKARAEKLALFAGGKSFGGRMTSETEAQAPLGVLGIAFLGFPLHPPQKPATSRAGHLARIQVPLLFMQGSRDEFAELELLRPMIETLPKATLHVIEGADHSLKKSVTHLAQTFAAWAQRISGESSRRASKSDGSR